MEKTYILRIISSRGHDQFEGTLEDVETEIKKHLANGKWLYSDGNPVSNPTRELIMNSEYLLMTNSMVGG